MRAAAGARVTPMTRFKHDILIIGSGAAGLTAALHLAPFCKVGVLSKGSLTAANTYYAQGGVAAVLDEGDSVAAHIQDTLVAGLANVVAKARGG